MSSGFPEKYAAADCGGLWKMTGPVKSHVERNGFWNEFCDEKVMKIGRRSCREWGVWYNDSASAEFRPASAGLPSLRDALYLATHGLKIKCPFGPLDFLRTWYSEISTL